jgi:hypothetical protein
MSFLVCWTPGVVLNTASPRCPRPEIMVVETVTF